MRMIAEWWFPTGERHIPAWMLKPKNDMRLNGRLSYQGSKQLAAFKYCKQRRVALDVGGHVGLWAYNMARVFQRVHSFEPVEEHRFCFARNLLDVPNVDLHPVALGRESGSVSVYSEECNSGYSYIDGPGDIPMITLDSLKLREVDFMKIDCEGYEENVVYGGLETIKENRPVIIVEQKRDMAEKLGLTKLGAVEALKGLGYIIAEELSEDYIMVPHDHR